MRGLNVEAFPEINLAHIRVQHVHTVETLSHGWETSPTDGKPVPRMGNQSHGYSYVCIDPWDGFPIRGFIFSLCCPRKVPSLFRLNFNQFALYAHQRLGRTIKANDKGNSHLPLHLSPYSFAFISPGFTQRPRRNPPCFVMRLRVPKACGQRMVRNGGGPPSPGVF